MGTLKSHSNPKKINVFSFIKYEHLLAGISGGVTSTLILHPLDLIKIRFAGKDIFRIYFQHLIRNILNLSSKDESYFSNLYYGHTCSGKSSRLLMSQQHKKKQDFF